MHRIALIVVPTAKAWAVGSDIQAYRQMQGHLSATNKASGRLGRLTLKWLDVPVLRMGDCLRGLWRGGCVALNKGQGG